MFTCISSNRVQPLRPQACIGRDAKKSDFLAVWTGGSFLITKWHTAIPILWWFIFIHGKKRYFVQPRFKLHNSLFCFFFLLESSPASFSCTRTEAYPSHPPLWIRCINTPPPLCPVSVSAIYRIARWKISLSFILFVSHDSVPVTMSQPMLSRIEANASRFLMVGLPLGAIVCMLWCSWVGNELPSGEPRERKRLLKSSPSLVEISKELAEFAGDEWRSNNVVLWFW